MAAPTGAPGRRSVHPGMHVPGQGRSSPGASAPSAGVCHRCAANRPGARCAERSGAQAPSRWGCTVACTVSEDARAQPRPGSAGTGASAVRTAPRHRPIPPSCVTTATPIQRHRRTAPAAAIHAQFRPGFLRPLVLQRKVRYVYIHRPLFPRYSAEGPSASEPRPLRRSPQGLSDHRAMRRRRYVDVPARIGTGSPTSSCTSSTRPPALLPEPGP